VSSTGVARDHLSPRGAVTLRAAAVVAAIAVAYHHSLLTLLRGLTLDTPLAYLGLVPFIALFLALVLARPPKTELNIHDRYSDYIVGLPLIVAAVAVVVIAPIATSTFFWTWRIDLLTLPLFAAGAVAIVFGLRTLWRIRAAIALLLLAWPLPYTILVNDWLEGFTQATIGALRAVVSVIPLARADNGGDGSLFFISHPPDGFFVSVASACAGVNGMIGFLVVALAFLVLVRGPLPLKATWLSLGLALTWGLNLVRILLIFWVGGTWGEAVAIDGLHPFIGLLTFNLGILAMLLAMPLFRLRLAVPSLVRSAVPDAAEAPQLRTRGPHLAVRRVAIALAIVVTAAAPAGYANAGMRQFERLAHDLGPTRLEAGKVATPLDGWSLRKTNTYPWVQRYFGSGSGWDRYLYWSATSTGPGQRQLSAVTLDVIWTADLSTFSTYGIEACYKFHNYRILDARRLDLGAGVIGRSVVYYNPGTGATWTAVYWEWPVKVASGERYERVVLNTTSFGPAELEAPRFAGPLDRLRLAISEAFLGSGRGPVQPEIARSRDFLVGFAERIVSGSADSFERKAQGGP